jgi:hypothetical protein
MIAASAAAQHDASVAKEGMRPFQRTFRMISSLLTLLFMAPDASPTFDAKGDGNYARHEYWRSISPALSQCSPAI